MLFITKVANASPSTSSAIIKRGFLVFETFSSKGTIPFMFDIFSSWINTYASFSSTFILSLSVAKCGDKYPRSNCIPSTTSTSEVRLFPSSTVITPSLPTFSIAFAIILPMSLSLLDAIVPTLAISA